MTLAGGFRAAPQMWLGVRPLTDPPKDSKRPVGEMLERFWTDAEKNVEEAVKRALATVKVPRHSEVQALNARLDELNKRIEALTK